MDGFLNTRIEYLKGVGEKRAGILNRELGIFTFGDLLEHYPYRYVDKTKYVKIRDIGSDDVYIQVVGRVVGKELVQGKGQRLVIRFADETAAIDLVFFRGLKWINDSFVIGRTYVIFGKPTLFNGSFNFAHPEFETLEAHKKGLQQVLFPMYTTTERMKNSFINSKTMARYVLDLLLLCDRKIEETLPSYILSTYNLISRQKAFEQIHFPQSDEQLTFAKIRLKFEELFYMQLEHQYNKSRNTRSSIGFVFSKVGDSFNDFYYNHLPFTLTSAQQRVVKEIRNDMRSSHQMNRLLQGDVGSGKTLVALLCMLIAKDNGYQSAILAPTELLAQQHYNSITNFLEDMPVRVSLLTGATKQKERKGLLKDLSEGSIDILIGTHAILEDNVLFSNLGLAVIDEQHRFGVEQRSKMWHKNTIAPHVLVMTATPIPRTLAMTVYGDLDTSVIDELPPNRRPVKTMHIYEKDTHDLFGFMRQQIAEGRQVYVVYPLIYENEKLDLKDLMDGYDVIADNFPLPQYQISIVHGQMDSQSKEYEMDRFKRGITDIMVATTVIEVGVDVPNATVMVIENAERFGLAQLHQLRGRVGRGAQQSYCILKTKHELTTEARFRIETMCRTNNGFEIADADLKLRGPGDVAGTQQSGVLDLKIADIVKDNLMLVQARELAVKIIQEDPQLVLDRNALLRRQLFEQREQKDFSRIS
ncbi:MAG TPA: ATP-dependent DNA helicase RecG [Candidatus Onthomorpha intestinigallinarum]|uniref:ATP-dependent DNA helicase RecG n=1 Tax=Candidatus Onthomorpha intestinigallinarum TaxID=2840880 RepID=A0A9D1UHE9_9BACT|nr:ATP-dependent DNA helicase RecG [Candidatus Onthomorpha intestinigallinarum]